MTETRDGGDHSAPGPRVAPSAPVAGSGHLYQITEHACRHCMGRILRCDDVFRCADCGAEAKADHRRPVHSAAVCCCGLKEPVGSAVKQTFRCVANPNRTPENPAEITVAFGSLPTLPPGAAPQ